MGTISKNFDYKEFEKNGCTWNAGAEHNHFDGGPRQHQGTR